MTSREISERLGIHLRSVPKAVQAHIGQTGTNPPGYLGPNNYGEAFIEWFNTRPNAKPWFRGKKSVAGVQFVPAPEGSRVLTVEESTTKPPLTKGAQSVHVPAQVKGLTPASRIPDKRELWEDAERHQMRDVDKIALRYSQEVVIPDTRPVLLVLLSDAHFGNAHTDYVQARKDAELVRDSDGVYAAFLGDLIDGWITPSLSHIQREQPMTLHRELMLAESWLTMMGEKLVAVVSGNHDLRVYEAAGLDLLAGMLSRVRCLYDQHEINWTLRLGSASWRWKARHEWKHRSQNNPSNPMEYDARWNDGTWDFAVGGHDHTPTLLRPFIDAAHDGRKKAAIKLGCYSLDSPYGRALNRERIVPGGSLGIMLWPDGDWQEFYSLEKAVRFLVMERAR
jgi:predicted phosphodiesterase